jgi:hypothetical protein
MHSSCDVDTDDAVTGVGKEQAKALVDPRWLCQRVVAGRFDKSGGVDEH